MKLRAWVAVICAAAAAGCASLAAEAPFDPANCRARDFNVYFEARTTEISPAARAVLDMMGRTLRGCRIRAVRIVGSADAIGGVAINDRISERRAQALAEYLSRRLGWPRAHMEVVATGASGAPADEAFNVPMRRRAQVLVEAAPPE